MRFCKCGCGTLVPENYKRGHARRGRKNSAIHNARIGAANSRPRTEEELRLLDIARRKPWAKERRERASQRAKELGFGKWMLGRSLPKEVVEKMARTRKAHGYRMSAESKQKISAANAGVNNGMFGKILSAERCAEMSAISKRLWTSEEHRKKCKHVPTDEERKRQSVASKRMWRSAEHRKKCRDWFRTPVGIEHLRKLQERRMTFVFPLKDTTIEVKVQNILGDYGVDFIKHKVISDIQHRYQCDIYIPMWNMVIECDGDYWHDYPKGTSVDKIRTLEMCAAGYRVVRLWEHEIRAMSAKEFFTHIFRTFSIEIPGVAYGA